MWIFKCLGVYILWMTYEYMNALICSHQTSRVQNSIYMFKCKLVVDPQPCTLNSKPAKQWFTPQLKLHLSLLSAQAERATESTIKYWKDRGYNTSIHLLDYVCICKYIYRWCLVQYDTVIHVRRTKIFDDLWVDYAPLLNLLRKNRKVQNNNLSMKRIQEFSIS